MTALDAETLQQFAEHDCGSMGICAAEIRGRHSERRLLARVILAERDLLSRMADHLEQWNRIIGELGSKPLADSTNALLVEVGKPEMFVEQRFRDGYEERNRKAEAYDLERLGQTNR